MNRSHSQESVKSKISLATSVLSTSINLPKATLNFSINQADAMKRKRIMLGQSAHAYMAKKPKAAANNLNHSKFNNSIARLVTQRSISINNS